MNDEPVPVPREARDGIGVVRLSGLTMLDRPRVADIVHEMGHDAVAAWVRASRDLHAQAVPRL